MVTKERISKAMLAVTYDCNLHCDYCFCGEKQKEKMDLEQGEKALKFILDRADDDVFINFFGGEPLLEDNLISHLIGLGRKIAKARGINLKFQITTNGTIFPKKNLDHFKKKDITLLFSTDGIQPSHDLHRKKANGSGSFNLFQRNLEKLIRDYHVVDIRITLTPQNNKYFSESVKYYLDKGVRCVYSDIVVEYDWNRLSMINLEHQYQKVADFYIDSFRKGRNVQIGFIDNHIEHKFSKNQIMQCEAGVNNISIFPDGNIYACYTFAGSWNKEKVGIIGNIDDGLYEDKMKPYIEYKYNWKFMDECKECLYSNICFASCFGNNLRATGKIVTMAASACTHEKITANIAFKTADLLLSEGNKLFCSRIAKDYFRPFICQGIL